MGIHGSKDRVEIPASVASKFTEAELDMLRKSFKDLAQRSPGKTIDKETFLKFFPMPGLHGERLFEAFDHKHTGTLDLEEFISGLAVSVRGTFDEKVKLIFKIYDIDNNQHVSKDELRTMLHQVPRQALYVLSAKVADEELRNKVLSDGPSGAKKIAAESSVSIEIVNRLVDDAFKSFDLNKDDKLSPGQFRQWVKNTPQVLDFLESVFPLHGAPPSPKSPRVCEEPLSPKIVSSASFAKSVDGHEEKVYSMASCPLAPESPRRARTFSLMDRIKRGRTSSMGDMSESGYSSSGSASEMRTRSRTESLPKVSSMGGGESVSLEPPAAPDGNGVEVSGVLYKSGRRTRTLRARFFLLRGQVLYYYYPNKLDQPAGIIFLQGCFVTTRNSNGSGSTSPQDAFKPLRSEFSEVSLQTNRRRRPAELDVHSSPILHTASNMFPFEIITSQGGERDSRLLYAKTDAERQKWIVAIKRASNVVPFDNKYHRLETLGRGKFAVVYKCELLGENEGKHPMEHTYYAVKVIDKGQLNEAEKELLRTEIAVLKLVNHPNIINMEDVFESLNHIYIVLEWIEGGELFDRIVGRARLKEVEAYSIVKQLAEALNYLHLLGVAHRDIKPENILCSGKKSDPVWESKLKICDFGLSKLISPQGVMKLACGTLSYVAPEVLSNKGYGKAADLWSVGVILYLVRRGRLPFDGETKEEVIYSTLHTKLRFDSDPVFSKSSKEQIDLIEGLLNKDPSKRLTAQQVLDHPWMKMMEQEWNKMYEGRPNFLQNTNYDAIGSPAENATSLEDQKLLELHHQDDQD